MQDEIAKDLPPYVHSALAGIARALWERALSAEAVRSVAPQYRDCFEGHVVTVEHIPKTPKGTRPRQKATYKLYIIGPRIDGLWSFTPGQLQALLREGA
jgi:hypothetical protein